MRMSYSMASRLCCDTLEDALRERSYPVGVIIHSDKGSQYRSSAFVNLAENSQRGTANSSILTSWDAGLGLGVLSGGVLSEHFGYHSAFWAAFLINAAGVLWYFLHVRRHFEQNKLR